LTAAVGLAVALTTATATAAAPVSAAALEPPGLSGRAVPSSVFVEFDRPSALQEYRAGLRQGPEAARRASRAARAAIAARTDELMARFRGAEGTGEIFRTGNAVPGVAVRANEETVRELATQPGVRSVRRITPATTSNAGAVRLGRAV